MKFINVLVIVASTCILGLVAGCKKSVEHSPLVTTNAVTGISSTSAVSGGAITNATIITDKGILWGTDSIMLTVSNSNKISNGAGESGFTDTIHNLQPNTRYYLRAYAVYSTGVSYGSIMTFTTLLPPSPIVYVAGEDNTAAVYWKNDTLVTLNTNNAVAYSVYVADTDVYVAGFDEIGWNKARAVYWKNGTEVVLTDGSISSGATSIFVSGSDVYLAGSENVGYWSAALYWKNGVLMPLTGATADNNGQANSIFVSGGDVYVAGFTARQGNQAPVYWKNGVAVPLLDTNYDGGVARSIFVENKNVYVAGYEWSKVDGIPHATYWTNGISTMLPDNYYATVANAIYVNNSVAYIAGYQGPGYHYATYWRNNVPLYLTSGSYSASGNSIFVNGNDVYIAGNESNSSGFSEPRYWKNGSAITLKGNTPYASANSIFVK